jgi:peptide/nickel transport system permease protein
VQTYILRRVLYLIPILFLISLGVFILLRLVPGDVAEILAGPYASDQQVEQLRERFGLDRPVLLAAAWPWESEFWHTQYFEWLGSALQGDLGESIYLSQDVTSELLDRLPVTAELLILTLIFTIAFGIPIGIISAVWQNSPLDYLMRGVSILGLSVPAFWLATLVILIPSLIWSYAPPLGYVAFFDDPWANLRQFVPPALILSAGSAAVVMRLARSSLLEVLRNDYIRTARAKGLHERTVLFRHALKNSLIPVLTILSLQVATLLGGTVIIELVFDLRGIGLLTFLAILQRDYPVVQGVALYIAFIFVIVNLTVDIAYAWLDPRIRYG